ncbi:MAG: ParB/RepB/Spo0J family partition protein [Ammonifex sp.]|jgi:ParB family chromosome partitioning protein|nr:MAG: ParB/RepB/Spo0J family partition protein [Ammonifex sp.]
MAKTRGLGKGLDALIPVAPLAGEELQEISTALIRPNARQARAAVDEEGIVELAVSINEHGLLQPVVVRPQGDGYELVAGERRWRAFQLLGRDTIPALVRDYDDVKAACALLVENIQRENLNPLEEATAYQRLIKEFGLTQEEVARLVGKSRAAVANTLRLLTLPPAVLKLISEGELSAGHARPLMKITAPEIQEAFARKTVAKGLSVREVEAAVELLETDAASTDREAAAADEKLAGAIKELSGALEKKVTLHPSRRGWRLAIYFHGREEIIAFAALFLKRGKVSRET